MQITYTQNNNYKYNPTFGNWIRRVDKIEKGEWIRTNTGEIGKVFKVELAKEEREKYPNNPYKRYWRDKYVTDVRRGCCTRQVIKNHSKNIIDLIEVGDYVNGEKINTIRNYNGKKHVGVENSEDQLEAIFDNKDVKSIVTKEQFASMEYKV